VVREGKTLRDSQKNVSTIRREVYYGKEGVPMGGNVTKKASLVKTARTSDNFMYLEMNE